MVADHLGSVRDWVDIYPRRRKETRMGDVRILFTNIFRHLLLALHARRLETVQWVVSLELNHGYGRDGVRHSDDDDIIIHEISFGIIVCDPLGVSNGFARASRVDSR